MNNLANMKGTIMKKLTLLLAIFILIALSACSGKSEVATPITEPTVDVQKTVEYYVAQTQTADIPPTVIPPTATQRPKPTATEEAYCPAGKTSDDLDYYAGILHELAIISYGIADDPSLVSMYLIQAKGILSSAKKRAVSPCLDTYKAILVSSLEHFVDGLVYIEKGNNTQAMIQINKANEYMKMLVKEIDRLNEELITP